MDLGIRDHVAVVTGGARGIGRAICDGLAEEGCKVVVWSRDVASAQVAADEITAAGGTAMAIGAPVQDREACRRGVEEVVAKWGPIKILVNNAGFSRDAAFVDMTLDQWNEVMDTNLNGVFHCTQLVVPQMIEMNYGRIINISSRVHLGEIKKANYVAAKGGVVSFTKALSLELGKHGITVNSVAPGMVETERLKKLPQFNDILSRAIPNTPAGRIGMPDDITGGVLYFAAQSSGFASGNVLYITGGRYG